MTALAARSVTLTRSGWILRWRCARRLRERFTDLDSGLSALRGRRGSRMDGAVHVAAPVCCRLRACPMQQARRPAQGGPELCPGAWREVGAVAAAGPPVSGPVVLDVVVWPRRGGPEVPA